MQPRLSVVGWMAIILLFHVFILLANASETPKASTLYKPLRDVLQINSRAENGSLVLMLSSLDDFLSSLQSNQTRMVYHDANHHALSYYHSILSDMDLLIYFHTTDDVCAREYSLQALSTLDSIVHTVEKVRASFGKNFDTPDEKLFVVKGTKTEESSGQQLSVSHDVNLRVAQLNCLSSEYNGMLCDKLLGGSWWREESCDTYDLPSFFEMSLGMKTALPPHRQKLMKDFLMERLRFFNSKKRVEFSDTSKERVLLRVNKMHLLGQDVPNVKIAIQHDASQEELLNDSVEYIRKGEEVSKGSSSNNDAKDEILQFLHSKYYFDENNRKVGEMLLKRSFPRPYLFYEECDFTQLYAEGNPSKKVRPINFFLLHKGPSHFDFPRTMINAFLQTSVALIEEQSIGMIYMCSGEVIKAFEATRDINGKGNFGTIITHNFIYGKRQSEIVDRGLLLFYNPYVKNKNSTRALTLHRGEPYDAQFVLADANNVLKHINVMLRQGKALNSYADWRDTAFFMFRGMTSLSEVILKMVRDWMINTPEHAKHELSIEKNITPYVELVKQVLQNSTVLREEKLKTALPPSQFPDDDIEYGDKMLETCHVMLDYLNEMIQHFSNEQTVIQKQHVWNYIDGTISSLQKQITQVREERGDDCGAKCQDLYVKLFVANSFKVIEAQQKSA
ncbi:hypothetical protein C9374_013077 [Naegleria lovaniensis]|uniref:Uncharacterized protein n=1 Tax=Naegleria lovaniensis TaxID=51637 RepID=A0AA88G629_NAELO|nr:uncharacterized protein C9374_013077 [Naegleria lovaniensis]KAG2372870.1 hypothetical protein C9374_013077 [Naegleria lovaniensis]